jgi:hypothetical protein
MKNIIIFVVVNAVILLGAFLFVEKTVVGARLVGLNSDLILAPQMRLIEAKYVNGALVYNQQKQGYLGRKLKVIVVKFTKGPFHGCVNIIEQ